MDNGASSYRRYLAGDDGGLADVIREYRDGLVLYISSFTGDTDAAEDLAEEVFIKLAVKKPAFRGKSSFKTWLYAIARNAALTALRRRKTVAVPPEEAEALPSEDTPETEYFRDERKRAVRRCMAKLETAHRQTLWLYYFEGFSAKEIAEVTGKSAHSVETALWRARLALRRELEKEGFEYEDL